MTKKAITFEAPVSLAIAENATTPDPGLPGVQIWSTTASKILTWNGSAWTAPASSGGSFGKRIYLWG